MVGTLVVLCHDQSTREKDNAQCNVAADGGIRGGVAVSRRPGEPGDWNPGLGFLSTCATVGGLLGGPLGAIGGAIVGTVFATRKYDSDIEKLDEEIAARELLDRRGR